MKKMIFIMMIVGMQESCASEKIAHLNDELFYAIHLKNLELVRKALDNGADINATDKEGATPLMVVADSNNLEIFNELLKRGADFNRRIYGLLYCMC